MTIPDYEKLVETVRHVHKQHADDLCWMDIDLIFKAAGLSTPDRSVGCKESMLKNCQRFIDSMCAGGKWPSYAELEAKIAELESQIKELKADNVDLQYQIKNLN